MPDKRSWRERQEAEYHRITPEDAKKQMDAREVAYQAARERCTCKSPLPVRKYLEKSLCGWCGRLSPAQ